MYTSDFFNYSTNTSNIFHKLRIIISLIHLISKSRYMCTPLIVLITLQIHINTIFYNWLIYWLIYCYNKLYKNINVFFCTLYTDLHVWNVGCNNRSKLIWYAKHTYERMCDIHQNICTSSMFFCWAPSCDISGV